MLRIDELISASIGIRLERLFAAEIEPVAKLGLGFEGGEHHFLMIAADQDEVATVERSMSCWTQSLESGPQSITSPRTTNVSSGRGSITLTSVLRAVAQPWMSPTAKRRLGMAYRILLMVDPS